MTWKDILKAPYNVGRRDRALFERNRAEEVLEETKPKEDLSTDISTFASKYIDPQTTDIHGTSANSRAFVTSGFSRGVSEDAWKPFTELVKKHGIDKLEKELGELYHAPVFISHRAVGTDLEDYVIDIGQDYEGKYKR